MKSSTGQLFCDFCGKGEEACDHLIVSDTFSSGCAICSKCVLVCVNILIKRDGSEDCPLRIIRRIEIRSERMAAQTDTQAALTTNKGKGHEITGKKPRCSAHGGYGYICTSPYPCHNHSNFGCNYAVSRIFNDDADSISRV